MPSWLPRPRWDLRFRFFLTASFAGWQRGDWLGRRSACPGGWDSGFAEFGLEGGGESDEAAADGGDIGVEALDGLEDLGSVIAGHGNGVDEEVEAAGGHAGGERLHLDEDLGDHVGHALDGGRLFVVGFGGGEDDVEAERVAEEGGDAQVGAAAALLASSWLRPSRAHKCPALGHHSSWPIHATWSIA